MKGYKKVECFEVCSRPNSEPWRVDVFKQKLKKHFVVPLFFLLHELCTISDLQMVCSI